MTTLARKREFKCPSPFAITSMVRPSCSQALRIAGLMSSSIPEGLAAAMLLRRLFKNFAVLTEMHPEWFSPKGDPSLLLIALVLHTYRNHLYLAGVPVLLQKVLFAMLSPIARIRGYRLAIEASASEGQNDGTEMSG